MPEAYIIDAVRTPVGRKKGMLAQVHPADLGAHPIKALVARTGIDPARVDDVVRSEADAALAVADGKADVAFGLACMARQPA